MEVLVENNILAPANSANSQLDTRKAIRQYELEQVINLLPKSAHVLEIGAGAGWQAKELTKRGFKVQAIDIEESNYAKVREWDVVSYDGNTIPFENNSFDVVFSSNVLEHIPHVEIFQKEIARVLKEGGIAIHVMPNTVWRTLTFLAFYPDRIKKLVKKILPVSNSHSSNSQIERVSKTKKTLAQKLFTMLIPPRHGETGNAISELYLFSSYRWRSLFTKAGWKDIQVFPCGLFYSGQKLLGANLSISNRKNIAKKFGSSCSIYVMRNK